MKKQYWILLIIFILTLTTRLYFSLDTETFSSDMAYYQIRHVEHINEHKTPIYYDELSYSGRKIVDTHVFHYFLALFSIISPIFAFKILPEIMLSGLVILIYFITKKITSNETAALLSVLISGFVPIFVTNTINQVSIYSLVALLFFYCIYCLLDLKKKMIHFVIAFFLLVIVHPISIILSLSLIIYLILLNLESLKSKLLKKDIIIFSLLLSVLINIVIFKNALLHYGPNVIFQNIPAAMRLDYFMNIHILDIIFNIGVLPLILGIIGYMFVIFQKKTNSIYLLSSILLTIFILLALKLIPFSIGLMFLGLMLAIMSAIAFEKLIQYIHITKFSRYKSLILSSLTFLLIITLIVPIILNLQIVKANTISEQEVDALRWIKENTSEDSVILANINEGHYIMYLAERRNVADNNFILAPNRYDEIEKAFTTEHYIKFEEVRSKYNINYVYLSPKTKRMYGIEKLKPITDCMDVVFENEKTQVYKILC